MDISVYLTQDYFRVAVRKDYVYQLVPNSHGSYDTPTVLYLANNCDFSVGYKSEEGPITAFTNVLDCIAEPEAFCCCEGCITYSGKELLGEILNQAIHDAETYTGEKVSSVAVIVPESFGYHESSIITELSIYLLKSIRVIRATDAVACSYKDNNMILWNAPESFTVIHCSQNDAAIGCYEWNVDFNGLWNQPMPQLQLPKTLKNGIATKLRANLSDRCSQERISDLSHHIMALPKDAFPFQVVCAELDSDSSGTITFLWEELLSILRQDVEKIIATMRHLLSDDNKKICRKRVLLAGDGCEIPAVAEALTQSLQPLGEQIIPYIGTPYALYGAQYYAEQYREYLWEKPLYTTLPRDITLLTHAKPQLLETQASQFLSDQHYTLEARNHDPLVVLTSGGKPLLWVQLPICPNWSVWDLKLEMDKRGALRAIVKDPITGEQYPMSYDVPEYLSSSDIHYPLLIGHGSPDEFFNEETLRKAGPTSRSEGNRQKTAPLEDLLPHHANTNLGRFQLCVGSCTLLARELYRFLQENLDNLDDIESWLAEPIDQSSVSSWI